MSSSYVRIDSDPCTFPLGSVGEQNQGGGQAPPGSCASLATSSGGSQPGQSWNLVGQDVSLQQHFAMMTPPTSQQVVIASLAAAHDGAPKVRLPEPPPHTYEQDLKFKAHLKAYGLEPLAQRWIKDPQTELVTKKQMGIHMSKLWEACDYGKWNWEGVGHGHNPQIANAALKLLEIAEANGRHSNELLHLLGSNCKLMMG